MTELPGQNRVVAITGTSRGIGKAVAIELARRGFSIACLSRGGLPPNQEGLDATTRTRLVPYSCDVLDEEMVKGVLAALTEAQGPLYGLINNAGFHVSVDTHTFPTEAWEAVIATNLTAPFRLCREAYPYFVANGGGVIINMGSFFDKLGTPRSAAYCSAKAGLGALTRVLAVEWARQGIRVINVAPGFVETDLNRDFLNQPSVKQALAKRIPIGRPGQPIEVARLIGALLAEDMPSMTGETIYMDGGQGMAN